MARRSSRRKAPRRSRAVSLISLAESYAYASILTEGLFSASPTEFVLGQGDLDPSSSWTNAGVMSSYTNNVDTGAGIGANPLSLRDIMVNPAYAFATI